jgi:metal-responsive CopG/Arc/MetJ family transcriptional regulator
MQIIPIEIPDNLAIMLDNICLENSNLRNNIVQEIIINYLEEIEDIADAKKILAKNEPTISLAEIERKYGLEN